MSSHTFAPKHNVFFPEYLSRSDWRLRLPSAQPFCVCGWAQLPEWLPLFFGHTYAHIHTHKMIKCVLVYIVVCVCVCVCSSRLRRGDWGQVGSGDRTSVPCDRAHPRQSRAHHSHVRGTPHLPLPLSAHVLTPAHYLRPHVPTPAHYCSVPVYPHLPTTSVFISLMSSCCSHVMSSCCHTVFWVPFAPMLWALVCCPYLPLLNLLWFFCC